MPLYEYVCDDCNAQFELKRKMTEIDAPAACPNCHGDHVARQISRVMAFTHGDGGEVSSLGSGGCGGCAGNSCGSCGSSRN
jgi:putative FmdB family regulatory protein